MTLAKLHSDKGEGKRGARESFIPFTGKAALLLPLVQSRRRHLVLPQGTKQDQEERCFRDFLLLLKF